jgi:hypothetical protein
MNVFIFPSDDRSGLATLIHHYSSRGHNVYVPRHNSGPFSHSKCAFWPALLCKNSKQPTKRNIEVYPFRALNDQYFGEDHFLKTTSDWGPLYEDNVTCDMIDLATWRGHIDIYHTLRGSDFYLHNLQGIPKVYFPDAKWVSSTLSAMCYDQMKLSPSSIAKFCPAPYEDYNSYLSFNVFPTDWEAKLLNVSQINVQRTETASFNHNFAVRQPEDYKLFCEMNSLLPDELKAQNYGGNARGCGADIRYSGNNGVTGKCTTLTPKEALQKYYSLRAAILFKQTDWGGGVFYHAMMTNTPIITTRRYVTASNSYSYIKHNVNAIVIDTPEEAARAVIALQDDEYLQRLQLGWEYIKNTIFQHDYWSKWDKFIASAAAFEKDDLNT